MVEPFDSNALGKIVPRAKAQIRARMKAQRGGYGEASLRVRSERIVERLVTLPEMTGAGAVASFWPMVGLGEVDLRPLDDALRQRGVSVYYPFMDRLGQGRSRTGFRKTNSSAELADRGSRFLEPPIDAPEAKRGEIQVVIVPALAVDAAGYRIGYGAGYYDATLGDVCPPARSVIVAYDFELMAELPREAHDVPGDVVLTDERQFIAQR